MSLDIQSYFNAHFNIINGKVCFQLAQFNEKLKPGLYHIFGKVPSKRTGMVTEKICNFHFEFYFHFQISLSPRISKEQEISLKLL